VADEQSSYGLLGMQTVGAILAKVLLCRSTANCFHCRKKTKCLYANSYISCDYESLTQHRR